jgi:hypothetical protein
MVPSSPAPRIVLEKGRRRHICNQSNAKIEKENKQAHYMELKISPSEQKENKI